jgi:DNA-binding response OmpR family regulator
MQSAPITDTDDAAGGFYGTAYSVAEIAALLARSADPSLKDEIAATQIATRRVMQRLHQELDPAEYRRLANLVFTGANTIARLMQAQHDLWGESADDLAKAIAQAVDQLNEELGMEL